MPHRGRRIAATVFALGALALALPGSTMATTFGSNLVAFPNGGVCPTSESGEVSCSFVQIGLADSHAASGGVQVPKGGVITSWRISTGPATPATVSVKARLRVIEAGGVPFAYEASPFEELPLSQPGLHVLPARLSIDESRQLVGIDVNVTGNGNGEAVAPFAYLASGAGSAWKWVPGLSEGVLPESSGEGNLELLFNATIEPDRDHDGYGDKTQDRCPEDPKRQRHCDRVPPRVKVTYARRQNFLHSGKVVVYVRSNEPGRVFAGGQIDIGKVVTWGIYSDRATAHRGQKRKLVLRVPADAREHAARSLAHGRPVTAGVTAYAIDDAGNESGVAVATIKPSR
jgi:hypothetical protein